MDPNLGGDFASQETFGNAWRYFVLSGDIFDCHNMDWAGNYVGFCWLEAKAAAQDPTRHTTARTTKPIPLISLRMRNRHWGIRSRLGHFGGERRC